MDIHLVFKLVFCIFFSVSSAIFFFKGHHKAGLIFLLLGGFFLRLVLASADPFLHNWDERFHALVAKNMTRHPFTPLLISDPVLPYDYKAWCCNHVWLHKQPLFLWQMALSLKAFGIGLISLRLPSIIMGTVCIFFTYQIAATLFEDKRVAYCSALLFSFSYYQLELTSGLLTADHNDVAFSFYVTASLWAFANYYKQRRLKWALLIGVFCAGAMLCKWLTGGIVYGGWVALMLLEAKERIRPVKISHLLLSLLTTAVLFLPWQLYVLHRFPMESSWEYLYNSRHLSEVLEGHSEQGPFYYFLALGQHYGRLLVPFGLIGIYYFLKGKHQHILKKALIIVWLLCYIFFSLFVKTKMPSFTFFLAPLSFIFIGLGLVKIWDVLCNWLNQHKDLAYLWVLPFGVFCLKPWNIISQRSRTNEELTAKIHNTVIYRSLPADLSNPKTVILNAKSFENVEVMFYKDVNAYHWYPSQQQVDSLLLRGYKIYAFTSHTNQTLPEYLSNNPQVSIIQQVLW